MTKNRRTVSMPYILTRSKRKTVAIYVRDGVVEVRAPLRMPMKEIDRFVESRESWIISKLAFLKERNEQRESFSINYGDSILYRGRLCRLEQKTGNRVSFSDETFFIPQGLSPVEIKAACVRLYKKLARQDINEKVQHYAKIMSITPAAVKINSAKSRWGSCSAKKSLNFSWLLIMADDDVIDYVVVHELAHIIELNHSKRFWAIVQSVLPDFNERKTRLKALQEKLANEDWDS